MNGNEKSNRAGSFAGALLAFAGTLCLPNLLNLRGNGLAVCNSWFGVFIWAVLWFLTDKTAAGKRKRDRRERMAAGLSGLSFALCLVFGAALERAENVDFGDGMMWISAVVWGVIFSLWICRGWEWLEERRGCFRAERRPAEGVFRSGEAPQTGKWALRIGQWTEKWESLSGKKRAAVLFCFFLLCWLPVFLAVYPGFFVYDAQDEFVQVQTRNFTTHHPLPHVLLLGGTDRKSVV